MEEAVGFEPTDRITTTYGFQDRCFKPLNHASIVDYFGFKPLLLIIDQSLKASPAYQSHNSNIWWSYRELNPTQILVKHLPSPRTSPKKNRRLYRSFQLHYLSDNRLSIRLRVFRGHCCFGHLDLWCRRFLLNGLR